MASGLVNKVINQLGSQGQGQEQSSNQGGAGNLLNKLSGVMSGSQQKQQFQQGQHGSSSYDESAAHGGNSQQTGYGQRVGGYERPMNDSHGSRTEGPHGNDSRYGGNTGYGQYMSQQGYEGYNQQPHGAYAQQGYPPREYGEHNARGHEAYSQPAHGDYSERGHGGYPQQGHGGYEREEHDRYEQRGQGRYH
ncbi:hypothetical protein LTR70_003999 [Exophiala xenobiotica]|uniref:Uncharacterized protein n=1 Tax=Lithohypha guttulata TaxID=1690604 RepID=A0ABR0KF39_9EURO|nr:hypothetical protein LTR24_003555 [Lithohypha guttulata]KAK5321609.1 hypothetical protein LTR70_003999 [Exophiala xenobiotica]